MSKNKRVILAVVLLLVVVAAAVFAYFQWGPPAQKAKAEAQRAELLAQQQEGEQETEPQESSEQVSSESPEAVAETGEDVIEETAEAVEAPAEGVITITVTVVHSDGTQKDFTISTNAITLREALDEQKLIEGEDRGGFFMVLVVDGETADFNVDGSYWAMLQDGEWMMTGVDDTVIEDGAHYEFVYTPAS